jgi:hypothetical protein
MRTEIFEFDQQKLRFVEREAGQPHREKAEEGLFCKPESRLFSV